MWPYCFHHMQWTHTFLHFTSTKISHWIGPNRQWVASLRLEQAFFHFSTPLAGFRPRIFHQFDASHIGKDKKSDLRQDLAKLTYIHKHYTVYIYTHTWSMSILLRQIAQLGDFFLGEKLQLSSVRFLLLWACRWVELERIQLDLIPWRSRSFHVSISKAWKYEARKTSKCVALKLQFCFFWNFFKFKNVEVRTFKSCIRVCT